MPIRYATGCIPSPPDTRDLQVPQAPQRGRPIPERLDLRPLLQPVRNQLSRGTCTAFAAASGAGGWTQKAHPAPGKAEPDNEILSPEDLYFQARELSPVVGEGAQPRAALRALQKRGVLTEAIAPYRDDNSYRPPSGPGVDVVGDRARNRIAAYARVGLTLGELATAIVDHGPLVATLEVDDAFYEAPGGEVGPRRGAKGGWHAVCIVGYDLATARLLVRNSWGEDWGDGGYAWVPISFGFGEAWAITPNTSTELPWTPWLEDVAWRLGLVT